MKIETKKQFVQQLHERFSRSKVVILTDYQGLDVGAITELRRLLKDANVEYEVVKNTMLRLASDQTDVALIRDDFKGPSAVAISYDDPVAPAKILTEFAKKNDKLALKVGVLNGMVMDLARIKALSALPSRDEMLARVLSTMLAVPTSFVRALNDVPVRMLTVLQAIKDQKEQAAA